MASEAKVVARIPKKRICIGIEVKMRYERTRFRISFEHERDMVAVGGGEKGQTNPLALLNLDGLLFDGRRSPRSAGGLGDPTMFRIDVDLGSRVSGRSPQEGSTFVGIGCVIVDLFDHLYGMDRGGGRGGERSCGRHGARCRGFSREAIVKGVRRRT